MNANVFNAARYEERTTLRIVTVCEFSAVRAAILAVRNWLKEQGVSLVDLDAWELVLVEAANNAVKHAEPAARQLPVTIEISCGEQDLEARVTDHTRGFNWPDQVVLPDEESESGRGLYLMQSLTDHVAYLLAVYPAGCRRQV